MDVNPYQPPLQDSGRRPRRRSFPWLPVMIFTSTSVMVFEFGLIAGAVTLVLLMCVAWLGSLSG